MSVSTTRRPGETRRQQAEREQELRGHGLSARQTFEVRSAARKAQEKRR